MTNDSTSSAPKTKAQLREERLKKALKANMGRRKAQTRARDTDATHDNNGPAEPHEDGS